MERTAVILGLTRQAKLLGLPMPYTMAVAAMTMFPFMWFDWFLWPLTGVVWYGLARLAMLANPNGAQVVKVILLKTRPTPRQIFRKGRRYV